MEKHFEKITKLGDIKIKNMLKNQCMDPSDREYGGFKVKGKGFSEPPWVMSSASYIISHYYNEKSEYYKDELLLDRAKIAIDYTVSLQHDDGTIDLMETNFHDSTTIAFVIQNAAYAFRVIEKYSTGIKKEKEIKKTLLSFFKKSADGMKNGGFHTPNHRWVMCSAMALLMNILDRKDLLDEIRLYLKEGIDCNEYGEYSERSTGTYNEICNRSLIIMARELNMPGLLEHVKRNLYMMFTYIEPDMTLCTMNSRRQDYGKRLYPGMYYENYLLMAHLTDNTDFAYMADYLLDMYNNYEGDTGPLSPVNFPFLGLRYMADEFLRKNNPDIEKYDYSEYEKFYKESDIVRIRDNDKTVTILSKSPAFMKFQKGSNYVMFRIASSYFGRNGRFIPKEIKETNDGYKLTYECEWGYVRPLGGERGTLVNGKTNWETREKTNMMTWTMSVNISYKEGLISLNMDSKGVDRLPVKLEMIFPENGMFNSSSVKMKGKPGSDLTVKSGVFSYEYSNDTIKVDGAFGEHEYTEEMRGAYPTDKNAFTVNYTGFTPLTKSINIK